MHDVEWAVENGWVADCLCYMFLIIYDVFWDILSCMWYYIGGIACPFVSVCGYRYPIYGGLIGYLHHFRCFLFVEKTAIDWTSASLGIW